MMAAPTVMLGKGDQYYLAPARRTHLVQYQVLYQVPYQVPGVVRVPVYYYRYLKKKISKNISDYEIK
jgi:hypothetical protein